MTVIKDDVKVSVLTLRQAGFGYMKIAKQLGLKSDTVKSFLRKSEFEASLPPKVTKSRKAIQGRKSLAIKKCISDNPTATMDQVLAALDLGVSRRTLGRFFAENGYERTKAKRGPLISDANQEKRLRFCQDLKLRTENYQKRILWSDEFTVQAYPNGEFVFYRAHKDDERRSDIVSPRVQNGGVKVMFWACMHWDGYGPITVLEGRQDSACYIQMLSEHLLPFLENCPVQLIFQQDNAPIHKSRLTLNFLAENGLELLEWPPQSPDLSPIEWFWNILKQKLKALPIRPRTKSGIIDSIMSLWRELDEELRHKVLRTLPDRLEECIKNKGQLTSFYLLGEKKCPP